MNFAAQNNISQQTPGPASVPGTLGAICEQLDCLVKEGHTLRERANHVEASIVGARPVAGSAGGNPNVKAVHSCFIDCANEKLGELRGVLDAVRSALASLEEKL